MDFNDCSRSRFFILSFYTYPCNRGKGSIRVSVISPFPRAGFVSLPHHRPIKDLDGIIETYVAQQCFIKSSSKHHAAVTKILHYCIIKEEKHQSDCRALVSAGKSEEEAEGLGVRKLACAFPPQSADRLCFLPAEGEVRMSHSKKLCSSFVVFVVASIALSVPLSHGEDFFFDSAGLKIHYTMEGEGEPVLLIHGFASDIQSSWSTTGVIKELSGNFQVIAIDNRGHGKSDKPHDPNSYGKQMMEDSIRLLDHLKIRKAHVVGYSMGARIVCALLGFHAERLRTAVIGGLGWIPPGDEYMGKLQKEIAESLEQGKGLEPLIRSLIPAGMNPTPEQISAFNDMLLSANDPLALAAVMRNSVPSPSEGQLRAAKVPVLALIGELDTRKTSVDRLNGVLPNLRTVVIPKAHHGSALGDPEFIKNLKAFLLGRGGL